MRLSLINLLTIFIANAVWAHDVLNIAIPHDTRAIKVYSELFADFEKQHDINVRFTKVLDMESLKNEKNWFNEQGEPIDIFSGHTSQYLFDFYQQGKIRSLNKLWLNNNWTQNYAAYEKDVVYSGDHIALPYYVTSRQMFYLTPLNKPLLSPPETIDELINVCGVFNRKGITPIHLSDKTPWLYTYLFEILSLRIHGLEFFQRVSAGQLSFLTPKIKEVFNVWQQLIEAKCFEQYTPDIGNKQALPYFYRNQIGFVFGRYHLVADINNEKIIRDVKLMPFPYLEKKQRYEPIEIGVFFANKKSEKQALIDKCLLFLSIKETQQVLANNRVFVPAHAQADIMLKPVVKQLKQHLQAVDGLSLASDRSTPASFYFGSHQPFEQFIKDGDVERVTQALEALRLSSY